MSRTGKTCHDSCDTCLFHNFSRAHTESHPHYCGGYKLRESRNSHSRKIVDALRIANGATFSSENGAAATSRQGTLGATGSDWGVLPCIVHANISEYHL